MAAVSQCVMIGTNSERLWSDSTEISGGFGRNMNCDFTGESSALVDSMMNQFTNSIDIGDKAGFDAVVYQVGIGSKLEATRLTLYSCSSYIGHLGIIRLVPYLATVSRLRTISQ